MPSKGNNLGGSAGVSTFAIFACGLLFGYLSCLHGTEMGQPQLIAFAAWSAAGIFVGYMVTWFFKYVLVLVVLLVGALWYTDNPVFNQAAREARGLRGDMCDLITFDSPDVPIKKWIC